MDKMSGPKEATAMRGMSNLYSGLGMLLGAGRISAATHDHILSLINEEVAPESKNHDSEKPPADYPRLRKNPLFSLANPKHNTAYAQLEDKKPGGHKSGAASVNSSSSETQGIWHSAIPETPLSSQDSNASAPPLSNLVCPWYSTAGYHCRDQPQGKCRWLHESCPGAVMEPLICSFWAENMCTKKAEDCRFAHYWAQHRQIAPSPAARFKRQEHMVKPSWSRARVTKETV